ncbi:exportin-4-like [Anthonomus grandis grandis]|uniref:exportin-4-like n=1 Tax=Anthonomus grandis grandis TaxID=2921223 RepID=UPI002166636F|nr:exportin-4-like [Anthonomus grandis grandis]
MNEQAIRELEAAAQIIMAPPNVVSNEQRHAAETVFLNFRKSKSPYDLCRQILEKSENQYVLFEAAEVLKEAVIREWSFLLDSDRTSLRQYLMQYITSHQVPHYVRDRILQVIAIMVKRASIDDQGRERGTILQEVENLIVNAESDKKLLGCNIISNLMQEYASTVKSTDVGLPWEVHFKAKKQFESSDLKRIFQFCVYLLSEVVKNDPPYNEVMVQLTRHLLQITERVLTWGYVSPILPKRLIGIYESVYESDQAPSLKLSNAWAEIMFNPDLIPLMFQIYWKVRDTDELAHHALNCLVQLASLCGGIMNTEEVKIKYLHTYLVNFLNLISNVPIRKKESLGVSSIVRKLVLFFDFGQLPNTLQETWMDEFTRLTCHFCDGIVHEEANPDEDKFFSEAFENMLEAWTTLITQSNSLPEDFHKNCAVRIFNKYVQCHLAPPDGSRSTEIGEGGIYDEELEDNDRTKYSEQLQTIGIIGRTILSHSVPLLYKILESRIDRLLNMLQVMRNRAMTLNEAAVLENLFEDVHWTILIAGHVLAMECEGETPMIPTEVTVYSTEMTKSGLCTPDASINALASVDPKLPVPDSLEQCDHVIRVSYNIMRLASVEELAVSMKLSHFMSPEVGSSIMWFLKRFCMSYLLPDEDFYTQISPILLNCLGRDSECSKLVVSFLLNKIAVNLYSFQSEAILLRDTVDLFSDMVCTKQKALYIIKTEPMAKLIALTEQMHPGTLPSNVLRGVYKGLTLAGRCLVDPEEINQYYERILQPLRIRFKTLIGQEDFARTCHDEQVQKVVIDLLECFIGVAIGSFMATVQILFDFMEPILSELREFLNFYKDYQVIVQLILEVFGQCAKYMLCYLKPLDSKKLYVSSLGVVQYYAKFNVNRLTNESFAEESSVQDLSLLLDLLTFILSKDCIDLCDNVNHEDAMVTASDVALYGLKFIMPIMPLEMLKFPKLCAQFYRLLVLINDIYPEKISELPYDMMSNLLQCIHLGLTNFGTDIVQACLDFIQGMASYIFRHQALETPFAAALKPFLKILMDLVLSHQINSDMISSSSTTIYTLICCYQQEYEGLVQSLIQNQSDPLIAERLAVAFNNLTQNVALTCERHPKLKFRDNFDKFIANVHGFLLIK